MSAAKTILCPNCGSKNVKYLDDSLFECRNCQTSFFVDTAKTTVRHKHTYTQPAAVKKLTSKKAWFIFLGIISISFFVIMRITSGNNSSPSENHVQESTAKKEYTFRISSSMAFTDQSHNLKIFMIGKAEASNYNDNKNKNKAYWAIYDAVKGSFDQINPLQKNNEPVTDFFVRSSSFRFDDGNIYGIVSDILMYKYDVVNKSMTFLNDEIIANVKELQSGISNVDQAPHRYSAFRIRSNSNREIMYYPIPKVSYTDNYGQVTKTQSYPNDKPTTFFFPTNNQPSYLVKYTAMYSTGYPFSFDPHIQSTYDENENFKSASFGSFWEKASRMIDMEVLNTDHKVYKMTLLDFRDGIVATGVKTNNISSEKFIVQWQDYDGKLLWSTPSDMSHLYDFSGVISKLNGLLVGSRDEYTLYDNQGKLVKQLELEELSFDLD